MEAPAAHSVADTRAEDRERPQRAGRGWGASCSERFVPCPGFLPAPARPGTAEPRGAPGQQGTGSSPNEGGGLKAPRQQEEITQGALLSTRRATPGTSARRGLYEPARRCAQQLSDTREGRRSSGSLTRSGVRGAKPRHTCRRVHVYRWVSVCVSIQESRGQAQPSWVPEVPAGSAEGNAAGDGRCSV